TIAVAPATGPSNGRAAPAPTGYAPVSSAPTTNSSPTAAPNSRCAASQTDTAANPANRAQRTGNHASTTGLARGSRAARAELRNRATATVTRIAAPATGGDTTPEIPMAAAQAPAAARWGRAPRTRQARAVWSAATPAVAASSTPTPRRPEAMAASSTANHSRPSRTRGPSTS